MPPNTTIVCTLVSRGSPTAPGQGSELLLFAPPSKRERGEVYDRLSFVLQGTLDSKTRPEDQQLRETAEKNIKELLLLSAKQDLRFVRRSKILPWAPHTFLVAFLFRLSSSYERGLDLEYAAAQHPESVLGEGEEESPDRTAQRETQEMDKAMYRVVEARLGRGSHMWESMGTIEERLSRVKHEHVSTCFTLLILPPLLDEALYFATSLANLSVIDVSDLALNALLQLVREKVGESAFRGCWPAHVPQPEMRTLELPEEVVKYRLMMFWRDVVAYHFRHTKSSYEATLSAVFLRTLLPLVPFSLDSTTSLSAFRQHALDSIAAEGARSRFAAANMEKMSIAKVLERASREKRKVLHVVTATADPLIFGVLRELVHYVSTISAHPYASTNPHIHSLSQTLEIDWASRPNLLHLTLGENRPLCTGAVLAARLWEVTLSARARASQLRGLASSYDNAYFHHPLEPGSTSRRLPPTLKKRILAGQGLPWRDREPRQVHPPDETIETYDTLDRLLRKAEPAVHGVPPPDGLGGTRVRIETAPDNALAAAIKASDGGPGDVVVLIAAEAVLPGWGGDVVAGMGSWMLAEMAKKLKAKVFVLATSDQILPSSAPPPAPVQHDPAELYAGWAGTLATELEDLDPFAEALAEEKQQDVKVWTKGSEVVPGSLVDGYITEKGVLTVAGCHALARERGAAETMLYGEQV
ncbi:hypothetical protein JCM11251_003198 [Rhodosporidiobolus azoricus]